MAGFSIGFSGSSFFCSTGCGLSVSPGFFLGVSFFGARRIETMNSLGFGGVGFSNSQEIRSRPTVRWKTIETLRANRPVRFGYLRRKEICWSGARLEERGWPIGGRREGLRLSSLLFNEENSREKNSRSRSKRILKLRDIFQDGSGGLLLKKKSYIANLLLHCKLSVSTLPTFAG